MVMTQIKINEKYEHIWFNRIVWKLWLSRVPCWNYWNQTIEPIECTIVHNKEEHWNSSKRGYFVDDSVFEEVRRV